MNKIKRFQDICMQTMIIDPFAGVFISQMNKVFDLQTIKKLNIELAGVGFSDNSLTLYINLESFFKDVYTDKFRREVIFHEIEHVIKGHLISPNIKENPQLWNLATDAQINENKISLHDIGITAAKLAGMVPIGILTQFTEQELRKAGSEMVFLTLLEAYQYLISLS